MVTLHVFCPAMNTNWYRYSPEQNAWSPRSFFADADVVADHYLTEELGVPSTIALIPCYENGKCTKTSDNFSRSGASINNPN
jgi:hypothetical protein